MILWSVSSKDKDHAEQECKPFIIKSSLVGWVYQDWSPMMRDTWKWIDLYIVLNNSYHTVYAEQWKQKRGVPAVLLGTCHVKHGCTTVVEL